MRAIDFVKRLLAEGKLDPANYKDVLVHRIDGGEALEDFAASTKTSTSASLIHSLRDLGRANARAWLTQHYSSLGTQCTVNIQQDYLDDMRVPVTPRAASWPSGHCHDGNVGGKPGRPHQTSQRAQVHQAGSCTHNTNGGKGHRQGVNRPLIGCACCEFSYKRPRRALCTARRCRDELYFLAARLAAFAGAAALRAALTATFAFTFGAADTGVAGAAFSAVRCSRSALISALILSLRSVSFAMLLLNFAIALTVFDTAAFFAAGLAAGLTSFAGVFTFGVAAALGAAFFAVAIF